MKLPLYFSRETLQACGAVGGIGAHAKFVDKIKPSISKSAPLMSFVTQAPSPQEAIACINATIAEVSSKQAAIAYPLLDQKKRQLNHLSERLKNAEEMGKSLPLLRFNNNLTEIQSTASLLLMTLTKTNVNEINELRSQISSFEFDLKEPKTRPTSLFTSVYSSEAPVNKRPFFTLGICLVLGVFLGLLVTGVIRVAPGIRQQIRYIHNRYR
jgi:ElaB/YqjD/DUF883 family membrane-anchored ribosome-binding protein